MVKRHPAGEMVLTTEWAQVEVIDLTNDGNGLGFNIVGGKSTGVVVKYVMPGSAADKDGRLQGGDHVLQVGAVNLRGFSSEQVASVLRQTGDRVRLLVARPVDPASADFGHLGNHAPIVPTKILSDPEQLDRHLIDNGYSDTYNAIPQCYEEQSDADEGRALFSVAAFVDVVGRNPLVIGEPAALILQPVSPAIAVSAPVPSPHSPHSPPEMEIVTVVLNKNVYGLGVTVAGYVCEKEELSGIFVKSIIDGSAAQISGKIKINDRIVDVDGESLIGKTNHQAVELLRNTNISVTLILERYLRGPKYEHLQLALWKDDSPPSPPSPSVATLSWFQVQTDNAESVTVENEPESNTTVDSTILEPEESDCLEPTPEIIEKQLDAQLDVVTYKDKWCDYLGDDKDLIVADVNKLSGLGISLEGTVDVEGGRELRPHHYIRSVLPQGPIGLHGALRAGDELLQVNDHSLHGLKHTEVVSILKDLPSRVRLVCARSSVDIGPRPLINVSQDREGFETRKIIAGSLQNIAALLEAHSDGSVDTSSAATLTDRSRASRKSHSLECVSNLATWDSEEVIVEMQKGDRGLGFSILDYQDPVDPDGTVIVVRSLVPGGAAEKQGEITPGDRLMSVNGASIQNVNLDQAVYALKSAPMGNVRVGIARPRRSDEPCSRSVRSGVGGSPPTRISS